MDTDAQATACMICYRDVTPSHCLACTHPVCSECLTDYLTEKVLNRDTASITCPVYQCDSVLPDPLITSHLDVPNREKLARFRHEAELEKDPSLRWCPKPGCSGYSHRHRARKLVCSLCSFEFCGDCQTAWHDKGKCQVSSAEADFNEWRRNTKAKFCPGCKVPVEKRGGCASMICNRCHYRWCWYCGRKTTHGHLCTSIPVATCLLIMFIPVFVPFIFIILAVIWAREQSQRAHLKTTFYLLFPLSILLGILLTPLGFALFPLISGFCVLIPCCQGIRPTNRFVKLVFCLCYLPIGLLLGPLFTTALLVVVALCPVMSLVLLILKSVRKFCRCCGCLLGEDGYPLG